MKKLHIRVNNLSDYFDRRLKICGLIETPFIKIIELK